MSDAVFDPCKETTFSSTNFSLSSLSLSSPTPLKFQENNNKNNNRCNNKDTKKKQLVDDDECSPNNSITNDENSPGVFPPFLLSSASSKEFFTPCKKLDTRNFVEQEFEEEREKILDEEGEHSVLLFDNFKSELEQSQNGEKEKSTARTSQGRFAERGRQKAAASASSSNSSTAEAAKATTTTTATKRVGTPMRPLLSAGKGKTNNIQNNNNKKPQDVKPPRIPLKDRMLAQQQKDKQEQEEEEEEKETEKEKDSEVEKEKETAATKPPLAKKKMVEKDDEGEEDESDFLTLIDDKNSSSSISSNNKKNVQELQSKISQLEKLLEQERETTHQGISVKHKTDQFLQKSTEVEFLTQVLLQERQRSTFFANRCDSLLQEKEQLVFDKLKTMRDLALCTSDGILLMKERVRLQEELSKGILGRFLETAKAVLTWPLTLKKSDVVEACLRVQEKMRFLREEE